MTTAEPTATQQLTTHERCIALTSLMLTLAQELRAAQAGLEAAAIEHYKLTRDPLYLGCLVWQEGSEYRVRIIPEFLAKLPPPPKPKPVAIVEVKPSKPAPTTLWINFDGREIPLHEGGHIAMLTSGYVAEKREKALESEC